MIKAVLFDFDGVVVQSEPLHLLSFRMLLEPLGVTISEERWYREFTGIGSTAIITALFKDFGINEDVRSWVEWRKKIYQDLIEEGKLSATPGILDFLKYLRQRGIKTAVVSGGHGTNIRFALKELGLSEYFDIIVGLEDVQHRKPHPECFLTAAKKLGIMPSECLAIEDSPSGTAAAHAAGMKLVCIKSPAQLDVSKCDLVANNFRDFEKTLIPLLSV